MKKYNILPAILIIIIIVSIIIAVYFIIKNKRKISTENNYFSKDENVNVMETKTLKGGKNNPGHLRYSPKNKWIGKIYPQEGTIYIFENFDQLEHGVRAWLVNAKNQIKKGYNTVDKLFDLLTPSFENPENVRQKMKNEIKSVLGKNDITSINDLLKIARIVFKYEGNKDWKQYGDTINIYEVAQKYNLI